MEYRVFSRYHAPEICRYNGRHLEMSPHILSVRPPEPTTTELLSTQQAITEVLYWLGITGKYISFEYLSYALLLVLCQPERLCLATKWLYPDVSKRFSTSWQTVERSMRYAINIVWTMRRPQLQQIAQYDLKYRPCIVQFLEIIVLYLRKDSAA